MELWTHVEQHDHSHASHRPGTRTWLEISTRTVHRSKKDGEGFHFNCFFVRSPAFFGLWEVSELFWVFPSMACSANLSFYFRWKHQTVRSFIGFSLALFIVFADFLARADSFFSDGSVKNLFNGITGFYCYLHPAQFESVYLIQFHPCGMFLGQIS